MIRIVLVDDQPIIREGLSALLGLDSELRIIGDAADGQQALSLLQKLHDLGQPPDIVLMDIRMPVMDGVAATKIIGNQFPDIKILVLTTFDNDEYISEALRCGARGYLLKDTPAREIISAIRSVHKGYTQFGPGIMEKVIAQLPSQSPIPSPEIGKLTPREREVLHLIAQGSNNREIAQALYISEGTVKYHITNILGQLNLRDRTQAALFASKYAQS
jgi:DNA-binding NarL/FixJ family response regulator